VELTFRPAVDAVVGRVWTRERADFKKLGSEKEYQSF